MQSQQPNTTAIDNAAPTLDADALQRRRMLLKGLGKGSAVLAATVPIQTLAQSAPPTGPARLCTVSGIQSNVGSGRTGGTTANCQGYKPSYFVTLANWPGYVASILTATFTIGTRTFTQLSPFNLVFGSGSDTQLLQLFVPLPGVTPSGSEITWAAALLSAIKKAGIAPGASGYFPYTASEVIDLFNSPRKADAEAFFMNYLQTATI